MNERTGTLIAISVIVGFIGDIFLQILTKAGMGSKSGWGLNVYFKQHGSVESTFIAGGMLGLFYILYAFTGLPFTIGYMIIYGILLDLIFRKIEIFPSLKGYYSHLNYFWSAVWGAIPMIIPLLIYNVLQLVV